MRARRLRGVDERGETLAELLVAISILGLAVVVLVSGLATALSSSSVHRGHTNADAAVRNAAECVKNRTTAYDTSGAYTACKTSGVSISTKWWAGDSPATFPASSDNGKGLAQVTITGSSSRATQSVTILKRQT